MQKPSRYTLGDWQNDCRLPMLHLAALQPVEGWMSTPRLYAVCSSQLGWYLTLS